MEYIKLVPMFLSFSDVQSLKYVWIMNKIVGNVAAVYLFPCQSKFLIAASCMIVWESE